jgi:alpha-glucosidase (family GH31 glycosyl hydrolase)
MSEGGRAFNEGVSLMNFQSSKNFQYLLGRDIFVAPILSEDGSVMINFPGSDSWVYLFDRSKVYKGGTTQTLTFPLSEFPVFLRKGSLIENTIKVP